MLNVRFITAIKALGNKLKAKKIRCHKIVMQDPNDSQSRLRLNLQ